MVKLYARYQDLMSYAKFLAEKAKELEDVSAKVQSTVEGFSASTWNGVDYDTFLKRSVIYTELLKNISENLVLLSDFITGKTEKYDKTDSQFIEDIQIRRINYDE